MAVNAGCDLECGKVYSLLPESVERGFTDVDTLKKSVARLMAIRSALGMFDDDCPYDKITIKENATPEHESEAVKMAEKGIVLLENDGILPLKENSQKILITGYNADNVLAYLGNYFGDPTHFVMVPQAASQYNADTKFIKGIHLFDKNKDYQTIYKNGFKINGITYRRLLGTTGGVKNNTIVFVNEKSTFIYP